MSRHDNESEAGAVAILTALLIVALLILAAFCVDLGMAFNSKRQLQTAADAAALAGALTYADYAGDCASLAANSTYRASAEAAADAMAGDNRPGYDSGGISDVSCNADGEIEVTYDISGSTDTAFGGLMGISSITTDRMAAATMDVPPEVAGLRPYAICGAAVPTGTLPSAVIKVDQPGAGHMPTSLCPDSRRGGNWWTVDCPEGTNNGTTDLADATLNGCEDPVSIVPNQGSRAPGPLSTYLTGYCTTRGESCLSSNPGNLRASGIDAAWQSLTNRNAEIVLPVFCASPTCSPAAITDPGGNNTIYPVHRLVGVVVCGYHWGNRFGDRMTGVCANNPGNYRASQGNNQDNYMLLVFTRVRTSGTTGGSACPLGNPTCDGGLRRVLLTR